MRRRLPLGIASLLMMAPMASTLIGCNRWTETLIEIWPVLATGEGVPIVMEFDRPFVTRGNQTLRMDLFCPATAEQPTPVILLVHGGAWLIGDRYTLHDWAADLAGQGYAAVTIEYRLLPEGGQYPESIADVLEALSYVREYADELNIDPQRVALFGTSAGAHLVLLAGMANDVSIFDPTLPAGESADVLAIVEFYGPTDFTQDPQDAALWHMLLVTRFLGENQSKVPERWREASPVTYARQDGPAVFICHGTQDPIVPISQARRLRNALESAGQRYQYVELPLAEHLWASFWSSPHVQLHRSNVLQFLRDHL